MIKNSSIGRVIAASALAAALTIGILPTDAPAQAAAVATATSKAPVSTLVVCAQEDGSGAHQKFPCLWDASVRGNRKGKSYVLVSIGVISGSVLDVGVDPELADLLDAGLELYKLALTVPAGKRSAAMRKAIHHYEQNAD